MVAAIKLNHSMQIPQLWKVNGWRKQTGLLTYLSWTHILSTDYHLNSTIFNYHKLCLGIPNKTHNSLLCCIRYSHHLYWNQIRRSDDFLIKIATFNIRIDIYDYFKLVWINETERKFSLSFASIGSVSLLTPHWINILFNLKRWFQFKFQRKLINILIELNVFAFHFVWMSFGSPIRERQFVGCGRRGPTDRRLSKLK